MADLLKDSLQIVLEKLATLCITTIVPRLGKNSNIILIHKKVDVKDSENYTPISLLSVAYKVFTKVIANRIRTT